MREFEREEIEEKLVEIKERFGDIWEDKYHYLPLPWRFFQPDDKFLTPGDTYIAASNGRAVVKAEWIGHPGMVALAAAPTDLLEVVEMVEFLFNQIYKQSQEECQDGE